MKAQPIKTLSKLINLGGNKKYVFINGDMAQQAKKAKHQKANTQNINIFNIIHNECNLDSQTQDTQQPDIPKSNKFKRTYDQPYRIPRVQPKTKHDLALYQELQSYKAEVEQRFNSSTVNGVYKFPFKELMNSSSNQEEDYIIDSKDLCNSLPIIK